MKSIKRLLLMFICAFILTNTTNVFAVTCFEKPSQGIYCSNGKPFHVMITGLTLNGTINLPQGEDENTSFYKEVGSYTMKVNGQLAFCADSNKNFRYGQGYKKDGEIISSGGHNIIHEIYNWANDKNAPKSENRELYAQIFIWAIAEKHFNRSCSTFNGTCVYLLDNYTADAFVNDVKYYYRAVSSSAGSSSRVDFSWIHNSPDNCTCIFYFNKCPIDLKGEEVGKFSSSGNVGAGASRVISYHYSDTITYDYNLGEGGTWKTIATAVWENGKIKEGYEQGTPAAAYYNCNTIANASGDEKIKAYLKITNQGLSDIMADEGVESVLKSIYNKLTTTYADQRPMAYYIPIDKQGNEVKDVQPIVAPIPSELDPKSCSNYLSALRDLGYSDEEIKSSGLIDYIEVDGRVMCANSEKECETQRKAWIFLKRIPNPNYSPKIGNKWIYIYTPDVSQSTEDMPKCGCQIEVDKFKQGKYANCAELIETYHKKYFKYDADGLDIITCNDDDRSLTKCGDDCCDKDDVKCDEEIKKAEWNQDREYTEADLNKFRSRIVDKENATLQKGKIMCAPNCLPSVDPAYCCNKLGTEECKGDEIAELTDAELTPGVPDKSCYQKGVSYRVDTNPSNTVSSKDDKLSQNPYCDVYCWESIKVYFPHEPQITHGEMYFWGTMYSIGEFAHADVKRICWTGKIDYDQYVADWNANEAVITNKATWYSVYKSYIDDNTFKTESATCTMSCPSNYDKGSEGYGCCKIWKKNRRGEMIGYTGVCDSGMTDSDCDKVGDYDYHHDAKDPSCGGCPSGWSDDKGTCKKTGEKYTRSAGSGDFKVTGETGCYADKPSDADIDKELDGKHTKDFADVKSELKTALKKRTSMHNNLTACQSITDTSSSIGVNANTAYDYSQYKMTVKDYTLKDRGVTDYKLNVVASGVMDYNTERNNVPNGAVVSVACHEVSDDIKNDSDAFATNVCYDANNSFKQNVTDNRFSEYNWQYNGNVSFQYTNHFNLVAIMDETPTVISEDAHSTYEIYQENGCTYERRTMLITRMDAVTGYFDVGVEMSGFGNAGHFDKVIEASKNGASYQYLFPNGEKDNLGEYVCGAFGTNEFYYYDDDVNCVDCDKGIDVVYRLIEMASGDTKKIFPGKDGKSRKIGSNWSSFINEKYRIFSNITNKKYVYDNTPLYSIDLTPTLISEIRSSNKSYRDEKLNPYTSRFDTNNNLKIKCNKDNTIDKSCISSYITELIVKGKIKGRFAEKDESARINLISKYKTCYDTDKPNC